MNFTLDSNLYETCPSAVVESIFAKSQSTLTEPKSQSNARVVGNQNQNILFTLYCSLILSIIDFCSPVWYLYRKNHINNIELIQRRASRFILHQRRGDQSYTESLRQLILMDLRNRRKFLSISFACRCLLNSSSFIFSQWSVNTRHSQNLLFKDQITSKTDCYKFTIAANFPRMWAELPDSVRDNFNLYRISIFKNILKTTLLKSVIPTRPPIYSAVFL